MSCNLKNNNKFIYLFHYRIGRNKKLFHNSDGNFYAKQRHKNDDYRNVNYDEGYFHKSSF